MARSLRSKIARKHRAVKREKYHNRVIDTLKNNGTLNDPTLKKAYAKGFLDAAIAQASEPAVLEAIGVKEGEIETGPAPALTNDVLDTIRRLRSGKKDGDENAMEDGDENTATKVSGEMSKTQLKKLVNASRLKRFSKKKKNRRSITTSSSKRRTDKR